MHPARAASLAQSNPSNETSAKPQLLSPEEDAARKARINNDMIYLSKRPTLPSRASVCIRTSQRQH
jgi:hypothetical protein